MWMGIIRRKRIESRLMLGRGGDTPEESRGIHPRDQENVLPPDCRNKDKLSSMKDSKLFENTEEA